MQKWSNLNLEEVENYVNKIFDLESKLRDKDYKIVALEFELAMEKHLMNAFKKYYLEDVALSK